MAYCFARDDASVEEGFRRIAAELFDKSIKQARKAQKDGPAGEETIHQVRKHCKKLRGLYRLVRPVFPDYAEENAAVRDAARLLSFARDAEVLVETFDWLVKSVESVPVPVAAIRVRLGARREEAARGQNAASAFAAFVDTMSAARKRAKRWRLKENGFDALAGGLERTGARKAMRQARDEPSPETFHEWRKRGKDHWYHSRLLAPIWPGMLDMQVKLAEDLGEMLGRYHDLCVLQDVVADAAEDEKAVVLLDEMAAKQKAELAAQCFALGSRLLAEEPAALAKRWRAYWKCWRDEQQAPVPEAVA